MMNGQENGVLWKKITVIFSYTYHTHTHSPPRCKHTRSQMCTDAPRTQVLCVFCFIADFLIGPRGPCGDLRRKDASVLQILEGQIPGARAADLEGT